ncbi:MAG TPA: hypothetical protein VE870_09580 [Bacteroidales bacterium]|nr:hypothetical protein [Bacteroidales bacterium]
MGLDIKIPIGLMFSIFGILLTVVGLVTNGNDMYHQSLGININLWTGIGMLAFGIFMLLTSNLIKRGKIEKDYGIPEDQEKEKV